MRKNVSRLFLFALLLPLLGSLLLSPSPARADWIDSAEAFLSRVLRDTLHGLRVMRDESSEPPKVIDHIHYPDEVPDFAFSGDDDLLEIWFPIIQDQDAAIFLYQGKVWMLDCGDERAKDEIVPLLRYLGVTQIDKMINTHPHHDHLNGLYAIDAVIPVKELAVCFPEDSTKHMTAAMEYCKGNGIPVTPFGDESVFSMGDGLVSFLAWQKSAEEESVNDRSAQFMVTYGGCGMLFMADMELRGQHQLFEALGSDPLKADILRYPHHGKRMMVDEVYQAIDPALVIITNSPRIPPLKESTKYLDYKHVPVSYTHTADWVIHLTCDGRRWLCERMKFDAAAWMPTEEELAALAAEKEAALSAQEAQETETAAPSEADSR